MKITVPKPSKGKVTTTWIAPAEVVALMRTENRYHAQSRKTGHIGFNLFFEENPDDFDTSFNLYGFYIKFHPISHRNPSIRKLSHPMPDGASAVIMK